VNLRVVRAKWQRNALQCGTHIRIEKNHLLTVSSSLVLFTGGYILQSEYVKKKVYKGCHISITTYMEESDYSHQKRRDIFIPASLPLSS